MAPAIEDSRIQAVLLDIEGTTTPVEFVHQVLFPYARERVEDFLRRHCADDEVNTQVEALWQEREREARESAGVPAWREGSAEERLRSVAEYVRWVIDRDRKCTPLKILQGRIWEAGYLSGELRGQVYADVAPAFARWQQQGRRVAIFSSGSVQAQKLLFGYSIAGDLTRFLSGYFDMTTGPKREVPSYQKIASALELSPAALLFISDVVAELDAASAAGMATALCLRPGAPEPEAAPHPVVRGFDEIFP